MRPSSRWMIALAVISLAGCASDTPRNQSFPLTRHEAHLAIERMHADLWPLPRPVIVLGGIHDPGLVASHIADVIRDSVPDRSQVVDLSFFGDLTFDDCATKLIRFVDETFPNITSDSETIEVDVVAFSMGGVVARFAASDAYAKASGRRLNIARLFTISSPHDGADLADWPTLDDRVKDMRKGSAFLATLNSESLAPIHRYELFTYVRLKDGVVGEEHAAPPDMSAWWVPSGFSFAHLGAGHDERILADILRRLRGEQPFTTSPPAPLP